jgi:hypothetical protein
MLILLVPYAFMMSCTHILTCVTGRLLLLSQTMLMLLLLLLLLASGMTCPCRNDSIAAENRNLD